MSNNISFVGRLGRDSELKNVGQHQVLEFVIANDVGFGNSKTTNWFKCAVWGKRGASLSQYMLKGSQVFVTGELTLKKYTGNDGIEKTSPEVRIHEVKLLGNSSQNDTPRSDNPPAAQKSDVPPDEDLPF